MLEKKKEHLVFLAEATAPHDPPMTSPPPSPQCPALSVRPVNWFVVSFGSL